MKRIDFIQKMEFDLHNGNEIQRNTAALALATFFAIQQKLDNLNIDGLTDFVKKSIADHLYILRNPL